MAGQPTNVAETQGLWDLARETARRSSEAAPLANLIAVLAAAVILTLGPLWLKLHYDYFKEREGQRSRFDTRRRGERG